MRCFSHNWNIKKNGRMMQSHKRAPQWKRAMFKLLLFAAATERNERRKKWLTNLLEMKTVERRFTSQNEWELFLRHLVCVMTVFCWRDSTLFCWGFSFLPLLLCTLRLLKRRSKNCGKFIDSVLCFGWFYKLGHRRIRCQNCSGF